MRPAAASGHASLSPHRRETCTHRPHTHLSEGPVWRMHRLVLPGGNACSLVREPLASRYRWLKPRTTWRGQ